MIYSADLVLPVTKEPIRDGAILVKDGRIDTVGDREAIIAANPGEEVINFDRSLIMPGLVNLHGHIECDSFGHLAKPSHFGDWLGDIIQASSQIDHDGWLAASREGARRYLEAGITCTADITRSMTGVQALMESGMQSVVFLEAVAIDRKNLAIAVVDMLEKIKSAQSMIDVDRLRIGLSPHSAYTLSKQALKACSQIADQYELSLTTHLAETREELELIKSGSGLLAERIGQRLEIEAIIDHGTGMTPAAYLLETGILKKGAIVAHCVWLSDEDIELLKDNDVYPVVCPTSNETLKTGLPPVGKFIDRKVKFGIGTDSAASNPYMDLFVEARKVIEIEELAPRSIIEKLTIEAAGMLGLADRVGSLESGKRGDLIVIDYDRSGAVSHVVSQTSSDDANAPYAYIVRKASKSSVSHTILGGEIVYRRD